MLAQDVIQGKGAKESLRPVASRRDAGKLAQDVILGKGAETIPPPRRGDGTVPYLNSAIRVLTQPLQPLRYGSRPTTANESKACPERTR